MPLSYSSNSLPPKMACGSCVSLSKASVASCLLPLVCCQKQDCKYEACHIFHMCLHHFKNMKYTEYIIPRHFGVSEGFKTKVYIQKCMCGFPWCSFNIPPLPSLILSAVKVSLSLAGMYH